MLEVRALTARYGDSRVLHGIDFDLPAGRVLTLLGRNGAGRSTVARALVGRVARGGSVRLLGRELVAERPFRIARAGIAYVPENREVFGQLNVEENLRLGQQPAAAGTAQPWTLERCYALFPRLQERRLAPAGALSGGEQQMLAVGRALMADPKLLMLDEPSLGLAPRVTGEILETLGELNRQGLPILLVEQKAPLALRLAARAYVIANGRIAAEVDPREIKSHDELAKYYFN